MEIKIFIGDIDEFYSDAKEGNRRWAVWSNYGDSGKLVEKLLGRFETEEEAVQFANEYDPGEGKTKVIVP
jgi:hypothetical protein